jgi:hypothetical protein
MSVGGSDAVIEFVAEDVCAFCKGEAHSRAIASANRLKCGGISMMQ